MGKEQFWYFAPEYLSPLNSTSFLHNKSKSLVIRLPLSEASSVTRIPVTNIVVVVIIISGCYSPSRRIFTWCRKGNFKLNLPNENLNETPSFWGKKQNLKFHSFEIWLSLEFYCIQTFKSLSRKPLMRQFLDKCQCKKGIN